jgi:3-hydroxy acid dehydrogenase / malonic semialdehyde reductase
MRDDIVLITGASSGIGRATAQRFHQAGARVVLVARRADRLQELAQELGHERVHSVVADITDSEALDSAMENIPTGFQEISILVNNAGCAVGVEPIWEGDLKDWDTMVSLNIGALLRITRWVLPQMVERNRGHIINIGSIAGRYPYKGGHVYGATKAFVEQFSHNLRCDLLGKRIRVTNIEPGLVETEFSVRRFRGDQEKADSVYEGIDAMTGEDIAEAVVWSASVPERMNINRIEMMATMQAAGGFAFHRES